MGRENDRPNKQMENFRGVVDHYALNDLGFQALNLLGVGKIQN